MSHIYFKPFTFKTSVSLLFLLLGSPIFNNAAHSDDGARIIGHYYVAKDQTRASYDDKIQWEVTSLDEWSKFMSNLKTMPKDAEKDNPLKLKQGEIIHFNVANSDQKSGHDIYISKAGIQQFSNMPFDVFYSRAAPFKEFLETELSMNSSYDTTTKPDVDINAPGIVVIYKGSSQLKNPYWVITPSEDKVIQRYKTYISSLTPMTAGGEKTTEFDNTPFEAEGVFQIYLNYPDAAQQILVVAPNDMARGTKIEKQYFSYKDEAGFFSMFKRQAEDNLRASRLIEEAPDERRKREAARGALF